MQRGLPALIRSDAEKRLFTSEQIDAMIEQIKQHEEIMAGKLLTEETQARVAKDLDLDADDVQRLQDDIEACKRDEPACEPPDIRMETHVVNGVPREIACWMRWTAREQDSLDMDRDMT